MKRILLLLTLASTLPLMATPLMAVLPPLGNSLRELKAIITDPGLYRLLGSPEIIENIAKTEGGYLITTTHKEVEVYVAYHIVKGMMGPGSLEITYGEVFER